jgi:hypothetical protein
MARLGRPPDRPNRGRLGGATAPPYRACGVIAMGVPAIGIAMVRDGVAVSAPATKLRSSKAAGDSVGSLAAGRLKNELRRPRGCTAIGGVLASLDAAPTDLQRESVGEAEQLAPRGRATPLGDSSQVARNPHPPGKGHHTSLPRLPKDPPLCYASWRVARRTRRPVPVQHAGAHRGA